MTNGHSLQTSPGGAVDQIKSRLRKLKRSSSATFNKLRRRKSGDRNSIGVLSESHSRELFVGANRRNSTQSLNDASYSRELSRDDGSMRSFTSQASTSANSAGATRSRTVSLSEAERRSVESGGTTASDSTFPATPDNSFEVALERNSDNKDETDVSQNLSADQTEPTPTPTAQIVVDVDESSYEQKEEEAERDFDPLMFAPSEEVYDDGRYLPASDLFMGPLETIYEVDSALPSLASRLCQESGCESSNYGFPAPVETQNGSRSVTHPFPSQSQEPETGNAEDAREEDATATHIANPDDKAEDRSADGHIDTATSLTEPVDALSEDQAHQRISELAESKSSPSLYSQDDRAPFDALRGDVPATADAIVASLKEKTAKPEADGDVIEWRHEVEQLLDEELSYSQSVGDISSIDFFSALQSPPRVGAIAAMLNAAEHKTEFPGLLPFGSYSGLFSTSTPPQSSSSLPNDEDTNNAEKGSESHGTSDYYSFRQSVAVTHLSLIPTIDTTSLRTDESTATSASTLVRHIPAYLTECFNSIYAIARHSIGKRSTTSYMSVLPPVLRLYTANRNIFLSSPYASSSIVDSLSYSWHADDVD